jgi:hypothetical protein
MSIEPWSPHRIAIASAGEVEIFAGPRPDQPLANFRCGPAEARVTHLAWARRDGEPQLFLRTTLGQIVRLRPDSARVEVVACPHALAVAADPDGVLTILVRDPADHACSAWVITPTEDHWSSFRYVDAAPPEEDDPPSHEHLAVRGRAVAHACDWLGNDEYGGWCEISWAPEPDDALPRFEHVPGFFPAGPLTFASETVLLGAYNTEGQVNILRHERGRGVTRVARLGLDDDGKGEAARVTSIAWDDARRVLWAASPELGLVQVREPAPRPGDEYGPS